MKQVKNLGNVYARLRITGFAILTAVTPKSTVFWEELLCSLKEAIQHIGKNALFASSSSGILYGHEDEGNASELLSTRLHGFTSQKTVLFIDLVCSSKFQLTSITDTLRHV